MSTYHRRVYRCEARQYDGTNLDSVLEWAGLEARDVNGYWMVNPLPDLVPRLVLEGDWLVKIDGTVQVWEDFRFEREWVPAIESMPPDDYAKTVGVLEKEMSK